MEMVPKAPHYFIQKVHHMVKATFPLNLIYLLWWFLWFVLGTFIRYFVGQVASEAIIKNCIWEILDNFDWEFIHMQTLLVSKV